MPQHLRPALEIIRGFKERHHRQHAHDALGKGTQQPRLGRENVNDEQIGKAARHAHDECADAIRTEPGDMRGEHAMAADHGIRLGPRARAGMQEWPRRLQFTLQETKPLRLGPFLPLAAVDSRGTHELAERLRVEGGVLPDVEIREMKTEDLQRAARRTDIRIGEPLRARLHEQRMQHIEIGGEFRGGVVKTVALAKFRELAGNHSERETREHQLYELPPRLLPVAGEDARRRIAQRIRHPTDRRAQRHRRRLHPCRERELLGERGEIAMMHEKRIRAQAFEGFARHLGRHAGMAVTVAADPRAEADARQRIRRGEPRGIEARLTPREPQPFIEHRQHRRENIAQIVQHIPALIGERRLFQKDLARAPQALERRLHLRGATTDSAGRARSRAALLEQCEEHAVMIEHREALRLGRMRCEHRLYTHLPHLRDDVVLTRSRGFQRREVTPPQTLLRSDALVLLPKLAHGRGGIFLHHI